MEHLYSWNVCLYFPSVWLHVYLLGVYTYLNRFTLHLHSSCIQKYLSCIIEGIFKFTVFWMLALLFFWRFVFCILYFLSICNSFLFNFHRLYVKIVVDTSVHSHFHWEKHSKKYYIHISFTLRSVKFTIETSTGLAYSTHKWFSHGVTHIVHFSIFNCIIPMYHRYMNTFPFMHN